TTTLNTQLGRLETSLTWVEGAADLSTSLDSAERDYQATLDEPDDWYVCTQAEYVAMHAEYANSELSYLQDQLHDFVADVQAAFQASLDLERLVENAIPGPERKAASDALSAVSPTIDGVVANANEAVDAANLILLKVHEYAAKANTAGGCDATVEAPATIPNK